MPLYEYTCTTCDHQFEKLRPITRMDDPAPCPECESQSERQLSVFMSFSTGTNGESSAIAGGGGCCGGGGAGCACAASV